jgi:fatty-acyl-CoA synthase
VSTLQVRTIADVEEIEREPLEARAREWTVHDVVAKGAAYNPDAAALHYILDGDPQETPFTVSFRDFMTRAHQTANLLRGLYGGQDGVCGVLLPMVPENYYLLAGGPSAGILSPVNWALKPDVIATIMRAAKADVLVALGPTEGFDIWETAQAVAKLAPNIRYLLRHDEFSEMLRKERGDDFSFDRRYTPDNTAVYCPTGGTTGTPKLAKLSHRGIAYKCHAFQWVLGHGPGDVIFAGTPLFHSGGIVSRTLSPLSCGITNVIVSPHGFRSQKSRNNFWKLIERFKITEVVAPPTMLAALISKPVGDADISTLKPYANTGSSGLPAATAKAFEEKFGVTLLANYGLTENTASAALSPRGVEPRYGASGIRLPYTYIKTVMVDRSGKYVKDAAAGESGVIAIKGPGVISGYVDDSLNGNLFFPDGWLNTGDLGRIDADGYIWVTGRMKDLIIRGGNNIDASVIDDTLLKHQAVELAAAVGKPDAYAGELPVAYVQLKPGTTVTADEIKAFARDNIPERGAAPVEVFIVDKIPLTDVGKIYKPPLRRDAAERTLAAELAGLADISVTDDPARGLVVRAKAKDGETAKAKAVLDKYTLPYEVN